MFSFPVEDVNLVSEILLVYATGNKRGERDVGKPIEKHEDTS